MRVHPFALALLAGLILALPVRVSAESPNDVLIIANGSVAANKAEVGEIRAIFTKAKSSLAGKTAIPINAKADSDLRAAFRQKVLKMPGDQETSFWEEEKVKKGVKPPPEISGTLKAMSSKKDAVATSSGKSSRRESRSRFSPLWISHGTWGAGPVPG